MFQGWWHRPRGRPMNVFLRSVAFTDCTFCMLHLPGEEGPFAMFVALTGLVPQLVEERITYMSKIIRDLVKQRKADTGVSIEADDEWLRSIAPTVHELLTTLLKDEGAVYEPSGLFLYASQGTWCASLSNRKLRFKRRAEGVTIEGALRELEAKVGQEAPEGDSARSRSRKGAANERNGV